MAMIPVKPHQKPSSMPNALPIVLLCSGLIPITVCAAINIVAPIVDGVSVTTEEQRSKMMRYMFDLYEKQNGLPELFAVWEGTAGGDVPLEVDELTELSNYPPLWYINEPAHAVALSVTVTGSPTDQEVAAIAAPWLAQLRRKYSELELRQAALDEDKYAILVFNTGARALEALEFLLQQHRCLYVWVGGRVFRGNGAALGRKRTKDKKTNASKHANVEL